MTIDAEILSLAAMAHEVGLPRDFTGRAPGEVRAAFAAVAMPMPEVALARVEDLEVDGAAGMLPARLYVPRAGARDALVFFHGGGFVLGDLDGHDDLCRRLAVGADSTVLSVAYRLAPEHPFPAAPEDAFAAVCWTHAHAEHLGLDAHTIGVAGDSAGGALAAVASQLAADRGGPPLAVQLLLYPVADHDFERASYRSNADAPFLTRAQMSWFWEHYAADPRDRLDPRASPLRAAALAGLPPTVVATAEHDVLADEGAAYAAALAAAGVPVVHRHFPGLVHGFASLAPFACAARDAFDTVVSDLRMARTRHFRVRETDD